LRLFTSSTYIDQAKAFMNAYWMTVEGDAEEIWNWTHQFIELDIDQGKEGHDLDEFNAHRFLERLGETKTIRDLRNDLRDIDMDFNKRMALIEYLLYRYRFTISDFVRRPQGGNSEELLIAQRNLEEAQAALSEARNAQEAASQAEAELKAALEELHAQEEAFNRRKMELETRSEDTNLGVVQRNKAKNELAQHLSEDPLPLRRAQLTTEAATKKAEKARMVAEEALAHAEAKFDDAQQYLESIRSTTGGGEGSLFWMDRELQEAKKYLPKRRQ
jgi:chromosome segregation ATPase